MCRIARPRNWDQSSFPRSALAFPAAVLNLRDISETLIVMLSVPFALAGGVWLMWARGDNLSMAVAAGFIALAGVAAKTGIIKLIYPDYAWEAVNASCGSASRAPAVADLYAAVIRAR